MTVRDIGLGGNMRGQMIDRMKKDYTQILSREWKGKPIWEAIRDKELTACPALVGERFHREEGFKLMFVGRAVNGWEVEFEDCSTLENTVNSVVRQKNLLDDFAKDFVPVTKKDKDGNDVVEKYYFAKSPFIRMMKALVREKRGTDEEWQKHIVWSNLFKVALRTTGNPSWMMVREDIPLYCDILEQEILIHKPDLIVFATEDGFFDPYPNNDKYGSFLPLLNEKSIKKDNLPDYITMVGRHSGWSRIKIIVCQRPEGKPGKVLVENILKAEQMI